MAVIAAKAHYSKAEVEQDRKSQAAKFRGVTSYTKEEVEKARRGEYGANNSKANYLTQAQMNAKKLDDDQAHWLKMLTTQLKNQDPSKPMDTDKMVQQMSTFSLIERVNQINAHIEAMASYQKANTFMNSSSYIGKRVEATTHFAKFKDGKVEFAYTLPTKAKDANIVIKDASGHVVLKLQGSTDVGHHIVGWDGKLADGSTIADNSVLSMEVNAKDYNGLDLPVNVSGIGVIKSVNFMGKEPMISIGAGATIPTSLILSMWEKTPPQSSQSSDNSKDPTTLQGQYKKLKKALISDAVDKRRPSDVHKP